MCERVTLCRAAEGAHHWCTFLAGSSSFAHSVVPFELLCTEYVQQLCQRRLAGTTIGMEGRACQLRFERQTLTVRDRVRERSRYRSPG